MPAKLTAHDIFDKEFSVDARGYSANEVDSYLDQVIEDYQEYEEQTQKLSSALVSCDQKIKDLTEQNQKLEETCKEQSSELEELRAKLQELEDKLQAADTRADEAEAALAEAKKAAEAEPMSLEARIECLEKAVFHPETAE